MGLKRNVSWAFIGNVVYMGSQWLLLVIIAKLLGLTDLGGFSLAIAIVSPVFALSNLSLRSVQATDVAQQYSFPKYFFFRCATSTIAAAVIICIVLIAGFSSSLAFVIVGFAGIKFVESFCDCYYGLFQKNENMRLISISMLIRGCFSLLVFFAVIVGSGTLFQAIVVMIFAHLIVFLMIDVRAAKKYISYQQFKTEFGFESFSVAARLFPIAAPLGFTVFSNALYQNIPKYMIEERMGIEMLGIYSSIAYFIMAGSTVIIALGQSAMPRLAIYYQQDLVAFKLLLIKLLAVSFAVGFSAFLVTYLWGGFILSVVYSDEVASYNKIFWLTMLVAIVVYMSGIIGTALTAMREFKCQAVTSVVVIPIALLSAYLLIGGESLEDAVFALCATVSAKLLVEMFYFSRRYKSRAMMNAGAL
ncbi:oligosaccharide flippase family protein [Pseudomonadales bacterium]|nr:oligosaccharide flippase family protein [Pseudomonadales bacterium]